MLRTQLSKPVRRSAWTVLDKVLNKSLDYDARILHPESFSNLAEQLDSVVLATASRIIGSGDLSSDVVGCLRLSAKHGGCDITTASTKQLFAHLACACQCFPSVVERLLAVGCTRDHINDSLDISGVKWCMNALTERSVFIRFDGVVTSAQPSSELTAESVAWGQARKLHGGIADALHSAGLSAMDIGKALLAAIPVHFRPCCALRTAAAAPPPQRPDL